MPKLITLGIGNNIRGHTQTTSSLAPRSAAEAAAWCCARQTSEGQLRSPELDPSSILNIPTYSDSQGIQAYLEAKRDSYCRAVTWVTETRARLIRDAGTQIPEVAVLGSQGKLLLYMPLENVSDGAASASSLGFYDLEDAPPWDTWFLYSKETIFSFVPNALVQSAQAGIDANPVDCISWGDWEKWPL